jgi:hypothetical protein
MVYQIKKLIICCLIMSLVSACTSSGEIYDKSKHSEEEFSALNTLLGIAAGVALVGAVAKSSGGSGGAAVYDYDWDWDYQPANAQWVCRGIQTGRYAELDNCAYDTKDDDRWPG